MPVVYTTAFYALVVRGRISSGDTVLIHSGTGGVGQAAIRYHHFENIFNAIYRIFPAVKLKLSLENILNIFALNINCVYTLEPHHRGGCNEYPQSMFWIKNKQNKFTPALNPSFTIYKSGVHQNNMTVKCIYMYYKNFKRYYRVYM